MTGLGGKQSATGRITPRRQQEGYKADLEKNFPSRLRPHLISLRSLITSAPYYSSAPNLPLSLTG